MTYRQVARVSYGCFETAKCDDMAGIRRLSFMGSGNFADSLWPLCWSKPDCVEAEFPFPSALVLVTSR